MDHITVPTTSLLRDATDADISRELYFAKGPVRHHLAIHGVPPAGENTWTDHWINAVILSINGRSAEAIAAVREQYLMTRPQLPIERVLEAARLRLGIYASVAAGRA